MKATEIARIVPTNAMIAAVIGKSSRWVTELRASGVLPPEGSTLAENVQAWGAYLATGAASGAGSHDLDVVRTRLAQAQAEGHEMRNAAARRELLPSADVTQAIQGAFAIVRSRLLALPARAAPQIAAMRDARTIQAKLTDIVHEALSELSHTKVEVEPRSRTHNQDSQGG